MTHSQSDCVITLGHLWISCISMLRAGLHVILMRLSALPFWWQTSTPQKVILCFLFSIFYFFFLFFFCVCTVTGMIVSNFFSMFLNSSLCVYHFVFSWSGLLAMNECIVWFIINEEGNIIKSIRGKKSYHLCYHSWHWTHHHICVNYLTMKCSYSIKNIFIILSFSSPWISFGCSITTSGTRWSCAFR